MYKLYTDATQANRFLSDGRNVPDTKNPCLPNATALPLDDYPREESAPKGCAVCSAARPCLFEVLSDPSETDNIASEPQHKALVATMAAKLATYSVIVAPMTAQELACWNCSFDYQVQWSGFSGLCCLPSLPLAPAKK
jgi:hypothetical protein